MIKLLLVEDDVPFAQIIGQFLTKMGYEVTTCYNKSAALKHLVVHEIELALLDYRLPDGDGIEILQFIRIHKGRVPVIIMTSLNDVRLAIKAMKSGAFDYISKPINKEELLMVLKDAMKKKSQPFSSSMIGVPKGEPKLEFVKGISPLSRQMFEHLELVAPTDMTVMIEGESGTGKEVAAKYIHKHSTRHDKPFAALDCGTLTNELAGSELFGHVKGAFTGATSDKKGIFEYANEGTVFFDEVGNLSYEVQIKLLRTLQEKKVQPIGSTKLISTDVRLVTATNHSLFDQVNNGEFRKDLYFRLNEFSVQVPPLRERKEDFELLIDFFLKSSNLELNREVHFIDSEVVDILKQYDWPGNIRELKNVIKRAVLLTKGDTIVKTVLPSDLVHGLYQKLPLDSSSSLKAAQTTSERELIIETLHKTRYNKSATAKLLGIDRKTLYNKMEKYKIKL